MRLKKSQTARSHQFAMKDSSQVSTLMSIPNASKKATIDATCEEVKKLSELLEKTERDLFETKAVLKAKVHAQVIHVYAQNVLIHVCACSYLYNHICGIHT